MSPTFAETWSVHRECPRPIVTNSACRSLAESPRTCQWASRVVNSFQLIIALVGIILLANCSEPAQRGSDPTVMASTPVLTTAELPAAKAALVTQEAQELATARATARPKPTNVALPTPLPHPTLVAGIDNKVAQGPFSAAEFVIRNEWIGPVGSRWFAVYAGAAKNMAGDGSIGPAAPRIYTMTATGDGLMYPNMFPAPTSSRPITIVAVDGDIMQLRTESGQSLTFNLTTLQYQ